MSKDTSLTAIDIGSDKITTLIAVIDQTTSQLRIVGSASVASSGVIKSAIVDLESVLRCVEQSLNAAERMAGFGVQKAFVSLAGDHVRSQNSTGVVAVANPDKEIVETDVARVIEATRAVSLPPDREIVHVIPRYFKVDSQAGIRDPVHMTGVRLETEAHLITASSSALRNISKCLNDLGIGVEGFVFSALAAADVCLTETEKELGVVLCDIGAGTTSYAAYVDGAIAYSGSIPIGARHITQDIALGCRIDREVAEQIKLYLSLRGVERIKPLPGESKKDFVRRQKSADTLNLAEVGLPDLKEELSRIQIVKGIIYPRVQEIVGLLGEILDKHHLLKLVPAGVVFTGGGAMTIHLNEVAERVLGLPARVGKPRAVDGLIAEANLTTLATSLGVLNYAKSLGSGDAVVSRFNLIEAIKDLHLDRVTTKGLSIIKKILP
ncbi:MAG TPA: cell division protein FtsA [Candidatus Woesebacteria bacterium]|nr:cell division protein FtsA [Candidatus Woesebacteria bacterium]